MNRTEKGQADSSSLPIPESHLPRIVMIGAGFGGLSFLRKIDSRLYQVVIIDQNNFHQFQPLFYQVAVSAIEPDSIVFPIRKEIGKKANCHFVYGMVERVDPKERKVHTDKGFLTYDRLIIATGAKPSFFGLDRVRANALTMKDVRGALDIRHFMLEALEKASVSRDEKERELYTNFVIVGGGPTGVELAGALAEFKRYILPHDYPEFEPSLMKIHDEDPSDRNVRPLVGSYVQ